MTNARDGGSPAHDLRREGTVTPREHNLQRDTSSHTGEELTDPERIHQEPSNRERRRAEERAKRADQDR